MPTFFNTKKFGAALSVGLNVFLIAFKLVVGIFCGSVSVIASAIDSSIDLIASVLAYFAVLIGDQPPDEDHPFGHGKFEDLAGLIEAALIIVGALFIINEAVHKLTHPQTAQVMAIPGIAVMAISLILDLLVSKWLFKIAKDTESPAILADAHHLSTDVWSGIAVIVGLGMVYFTGQHWIDAVTALVVAGLILGVGIKIVTQVFHHLVDKALPPEEMDRIRQTIISAVPAHEPIAIDDLKTRRSGSHRLIVFNLKVAPQLTVDQAHQYCDAVENALLAAYPTAQVSIHLEPLSPQDTLITGEKVFASK